MTIVAQNDSKSMYMLKRRKEKVYFCWSNITTSIYLILCRFCILRVYCTREGNTTKKQNKLICVTIKSSVKCWIVKLKL